MAQYCCKWNEHVPNLLSGIKSFKDAENYVDVTLLCGGHEIKVHKLILSTSSRVFHDLFLSSPCPHPVIILQDIKFSILQAIVDFIYRGEINVRNDELELLSRAAKALGIKGLSDICKDVLLGALIGNIEEGLQSNDVSVNEPSSDPSPPKKRAREESHDSNAAGSDHRGDLDTTNASFLPEENINLNSEVNQTFTFSFGTLGTSSVNNSFNSGIDTMPEETSTKKNAATEYEINPTLTKNPPLLESIIKKELTFSPEVDDTLKKNKRSVIWNFFTPVSENIASCNSCNTKKSYFSTTSNLRKHLRRKHPSIDIMYVQQLQDKNKKAGSKALVPMKNFVDPSMIQNIDNPADFPRKKTSELWKYFTKKSNMTAQCNSCLSYQSYRASITNLKKHLQRKHPSIDLGSSSRNDDENIEFQVEPIAQVPAPPEEKHPCRNLTGKGQKKSYLWNFYTPLNDEIAVCNICLKNMSYKSSTSNLKSHLMNKHPSLDLQSAQELQELAERNRFQSEITDFETHTVAMTVEEAMNEGLVYQPDEKTLQQISICNNVVNEGQTEPTNNAASISQGKPPHSQLGKKKSYLWNFFTPLNDEMASCKICSAEKSYRSSISNLKKHLMRTHPTIKLPSATMNSSQSSTPQVTLMVAEVQPEVASTNEEVLQEITVQSNMLSDENSMLSPFILKFA